MVMRSLLLLFLTFAVGSTHAADIVASLDRNPVGVNESFQLSFEVRGDQDGEPDFTPLETFFDILGRTQSHSIQILNGDMQRTRQYQLMLMAREPGHYTIPAIAFGGDRSNTLPLEVKEADASDTATDDGLILETELDRRETPVQGQLLYTVRLLRSVNLRSGNLSDPRFSGVEVMVEKLGEDSGYETIRNGVRYSVVERRYALFPQQSGTLVIEPTVFQGQVLEGSRFAFNEILKAKRLTSERYEVKVQAPPADAPRPWLPAKEVRLVEEWPSDPPVFRVGEPVTRTLTMMARGMPAAQLPALPHTTPEGIKAYPDQPLLKDEYREDGVLGVRQEKIALMPTREGRHTLPAIEVAWWNTERDALERARIPARSIEVLAVEGTQQAPPSVPEVPITPEPNATATTEIPATTTQAGYWPWLSGLLALGWAATALAWWWSRRESSVLPGSNAVGGSFRAVRRACRKDNAVAARDALLHWARGQWPAQPPTSLGGLAVRVDEAFEAALRELERQLYAPGGGDWRGDALLQHAERWRRENRKSRNTKERTALAPLYPRR